MTCYFQAVFHWALKQKTRLAPSGHIFIGSRLLGFNRHLSLWIDKLRICRWWQLRVMPPKPKEISDGWRGDDSFQLVLRAGQVLQVATGWGWGQGAVQWRPNDWSLFWNWFVAQTGFQVTTEARMALTSWSLILHLIARINNCKYWWKCPFPSLAFIITVDSELCRCLPHFRILPHFPSMCQT